jgi:PAS domain S-box-containing protein
LEETTNDLSNLLVSTEIATLFLDRRFCIRRYTPAIGGLMRLIPTDVGRAVTDITWRFQDERLLDDAASVLAGHAVDPHEIQSDEEHWYLRRVMPYRTEDGHVEGVVVTFTDITQRKAVEIALRQSELHLRRITDAMPVLISYIDINLRYRFNNRAYQRWFGVEPEAVEGKHLADVLGEEVIELIQPKLDRVLEGEAVNYEEWLPYANGDARYVSVQYIPDRDEQGAIQGFFALVTDLTEKRRAEEKFARLNRENQRNLDEMRALLDAAPVGIFLGRDKACTEMVMNRAGARMLRIPTDVNPSLSGPDMERLDFRVYHDGKELKPDDLPMQLAARLGRPVTGFEERVAFSDGTHIDLLTYAAPLFDSEGEVRGCVGTFADITETQELKQRYWAATERLRIHIENTPLAIIEWDRNMHILNWSGSAEKVFGWTAEEAICNNFISLGLVYSDDLPAVESSVKELIQRDIETGRRLNRNCRSDGSVIWCEWFNSVIRDSKGEFVSALSVALDVTERQRLEQQLKAHSHQLEKDSQRKDIFFAMLGHELRNPLTPIRNVIQILNLRHEQNIDLDWVTQVLDRQTSHLQRMVDDLLDMARIRKGVLSIEMTRVDLKSLIQEAISALQPMIEEKGHQLQTVLPDTPIEVTGDATRLLQVISNLLSNAVRYTPENGEITILLSQVDGNRVRLEVKDNGNGLSGELLPHVFDILNQARAHPERSNAGLGLGLALVKQIVQLHRGEVTAESPGLGQGSCFTVYLPLRDGAEEKAVLQCERQAADVSGNESLRILVVDDNPDVLESLRYLLTALGHKVRALDAGSKVEDQVRQQLPDLVLLDLGMPDVDGYEVARRLALFPNRKRFQVIAVTGYAADAQGTSEQGENFDAYLIKPLTLDMLSPFLKKRE